MHPLLPGSLFPSSDYFLITWVQGDFYSSLVLCDGLAPELTANYHLCLSLKFYEKELMLLDSQWHFSLGEGTGDKRGVGVGLWRGNGQTWMLGLSPHQGL